MVGSLRGGSQATCRSASPIGNMSSGATSSVTNDSIAPSRTVMFASGFACSTFMRSRLASMSLSPARFVDAEAQPVLAAFLGRLDLFILWSTALLGIGISVVGKIPRNKGLAAAFVVWLLATLSTVGQAFAASS